MNPETPQTPPPSAPNQTPPTSVAPQPALPVKTSHTLRTILLITIPLVLLLCIGSLLLVGTFLSRGFSHVSTTFSNDGGIDTSPIEAAIKATSPKIVSVEVSTGIDGLTHNLNVDATISTPNLTGNELNNILREAYTGANGKAEDFYFTLTSQDGEYIDFTETVYEAGVLQSDITNATHTVRYTAKNLGYKFD